MSQKTKTSVQGFETKTVIEIGNLVFFKKFVLLQINEGAHLGVEQVNKIRIIVSQYYQDRPYGYLCNKETVLPLLNNILADMTLRSKGIL
jgi:hypothetical protein